MKYREDLKQNGLVEDWGMGWAYVLGWISAILMSVGSVLILIDRNADELVYREKTSYSESIEEDC